MPSLQFDFIEQLNSVLYLLRGEGATWINFSLLAWQFLFVLALTVGYHWRQNAIFTWTLHPALILFTAGVFLFQFLVRHAYIDFSLWEAFTYRPTLAPTRLLSFLSAIVLIRFVIHQWTTSTRCTPLEYLGQSSLYAYACSLVLVDTLISRVSLNCTSYSGMLLILILTAASLWLPALVHRQLKRIQQQNSLAHGK